MTRKLLIVAVLVFLGMTVGAVVLPKLAGPYAKKMIEEKGSVALGAPLKVGEVQIALWPPISVRMTGVQFVHKPVPLTEAKVSLRELSVLVPLSLSMLRGKGFAGSLSLKEPEIEITQQVQPPGTSAISEASTASRTSPTPSLAGIAADFTVKKGKIVFRRGADIVRLEDLNLHIEAKDLSLPAKIHLGFLSSFDWAGLQFKTPLQLDSTLEVKPQPLVVSTTLTSIQVAGFEVSIKGRQDVEVGTGQWKARIIIPEVSSLKAPPQFLPPGQWSGQLALDVTASQSARSPWKAEGFLRVQGLKGTYDFQAKDVTAQGKTALEAAMRFAYDDGLLLPEMAVTANFDETSLRYGERFQKTSGVPFSLNLKGSYSKTALSFQQCDLRLAQLAAHASGTVDTKPGQISDLRISLPKAAVAGLEKIFPPLARYPLTGFIEMQAAVKGDLQNPMGLTVEVNPLVVEKLKGGIEYQSSAATARGPFEADAKVVLRSKGKDLQSATVSLRTDLSGLAVTSGQYLNKPMQVPLKLALEAKQKGGELTLNSSTLSTPAGNLQLAGSVREIQAPVINLKLTAKDLDLEKLGRLVPVLASYHPRGRPQGHVQAQVAMNGRYDFKQGIEKSPLAVSGSLKAQIPDLVYKTPNIKAKEVAKEDYKPVPLGPLVPDWPVMRSLDFQGTLQLKHMSFNELELKEVAVSGRVQGGKAGIAGRIKSFLGGSVELGSLQVPLLEKMPTVRVALRTDGVDIAKAVAWSAPTWKGLVEGAATGNLSAVVPDRSRPDFLEKIEMQGALTIRNGYLSTLPFEQMVKAKVSQIPGIGNQLKLPSTQGVRGQIVAQFRQAGGKLAIQKLEATGVDRSELRATGTVGVDKNMDVSGQIALANAPVQGPVREANSDSSGRLLVPIRFSGNIFSPEMHLLDETIQQMLANTARHQAEKAKSQALARATALADEQKKKTQAAAKQAAEDAAKKAAEEAAKSLKKFF